jgi:hypothetical protein
MVKQLPPPQFGSAQVLQTGFSSPEHAAFVEQLKKRESL